MWQFAEAVRGIGDASSSLGTPVTGGNVSFYNETKGRAIYPTPVIGMLGALPRADRAVGSAFSTEGDAILVLGTTDPADLGGSDYAKIVNGTIGGIPPRLEVGREKALIRFLVKAAERGLLRSAHDPAGGGLAVALAESAIYGDVGFSVSLAGDPHRILFSESPSRAVVSCDPAHVDEVNALAGESGVPVDRAGTVGGTELDFGWFAATLEGAKTSYESALPDALSTPTMTA